MKNRIISILLVICMAVSFMPGMSLAAEPDGTVKAAHEGCRKDTSDAVKVRSYAELQTAVAGTATDIVLTTSDENATEETWLWDNTWLTINRTVHITVEEGKTITLKRESGNSTVFYVPAAGKLILGDGTLTYSGDEELTAYQNGHYTVQSTGGKLIVDGGAVWKAGTMDGKTSAYFIDETGAQVQKYNDGISSTDALINCESGQLDIWGGVTLQNNQATDSYGAIRMRYNGSDPAPTLNLYGGIVEWCTTQGNEDGSGAIYCGKKDINWLNCDPSTQYGTINFFDGEVRHNANTDTNGAGDGTGIDLDCATLNLYGGSVSYNCGAQKSGIGYNEPAADGGGIDGRAGAVLNLYGGEVTHNWTGGFGGGVCLWNSVGNLVGTEITNNTACFGGGVAIAGARDGGNNDYDGSNLTNNVFSKLTMTGGLIAYNEAKGATGGGVGGGICAGTASRPNGSVLDLRGGKITQNKAQNGGGIAAYAGHTTALKMSGTAEIVSNAAFSHGGGAYFTNSDNNAIHPLLEMSGKARIDTANTVFFDNVIKNWEGATQVPVKVTGRLESDGTVAFFGFSDEFWGNGTAGTNHAVAEEDLNIVEFENGLDIQENKFGLDNDAWYLKNVEAADTDTPGYLTLKNFGTTKRYWIRNGTPVNVTENGATTPKKYYRIYDTLKDAFDQAADGDTLYIFYNTTMNSTAVVEGKHLTLLAESTSTAGMAAGAPSHTCSMEERTFGSGENRVSYYVMNGKFLRYNDAETSVGKKYTVNNENTANETTTGGQNTYTLADYDYNIRNDYTITLASELRLDSTTGGASSDTAAAIIVRKENDKEGQLDFGQERQAGIGFGALTFNGNFSNPLDGPMLYVDAGSTAILHSGVTMTNHTNVSTAMPGMVYSKGELKMEAGSTLSGGVSPMAGAVYIADGGAFDLDGGDVTGNTGAMPRYKAAAVRSQGAGVGEDNLYFGQPKYYYGAGAVCAAAGGKFNMTGGAVSGNRGEWGAAAGLGGTMGMTGGTISGNAAVIGTGTPNTQYDLTISGYEDAVGTSGQSNPGCGGGLYLEGGSATLSGVTITENYAQQNGGGIADYDSTMTFGSGRTAITYNTAGSVEAGTKNSMGGGIFISRTGGTADVTTNVTANVTLTDNTAEIGGGLAALGTSETQKAAVTIASNVSSNTAKYGGGVYAGAYSEVTIQNAKLEDNTATYGGGAYIDCAKTPAGETTETTALIDPGKGKDLPDTPTREQIAEKLGVDDADSNGKLVLSAGEINNNHLTSVNDRTDGSGGGAYIRGDLVLNRGAKVSANDRLYLEAGHVATLGADYTAQGQTTEDKLTFNSRETALGTNIIKMAESQGTEQFNALLGDEGKKVAHYKDIPMARGSEEVDEENYIELNYFSITYYDRLPGDTSALGVHKITDMVVPGKTYTILGWNAVNDRVGDAEKKLQNPPGQRLEGWMLATMQDGKLTTDGEVAYHTGDDYTNNANIILVAQYTSNNYLAVMLNHRAGVSDPKDTTSNNEIGAVKLHHENLTTTAGGVTSYFAYDMKMQLLVENLTENGHRKGVLQSVELYEQDRSVVEGIEPGEGEFRYVGFIYKKRAVAAFEPVTLTNGSEEMTYQKTGVPSGWLAADGVSPLPEEDKERFMCEDGILSYVGKEKPFLVVATFAEPMVELKMTGTKTGGGENTLTEYYDTVYQAYTRMTNVAGGKRFDTTWIEAVITPLKADEEDGSTVSYYGEGNEVIHSLNTPVSDFHVTLDLNGFDLDMTGAKAKNLGEDNSFTVKNGTFIGHAAAPANSQFIVGPGGTLTFENATLNAATTYGVIVKENTDEDGKPHSGSLSIDRNSHVGKVLLEGKNTHITALDPAGWTERAPDAEYAATIYIDLRALRTTATVWDKDANVQFPTQEGTTDTTRQVLSISSTGASNGHAVRSNFQLEDSVIDVEQPDAEEFALSGDDAGYWFITTQGKLYPRIKDVIPQLICLSHPNSESIRTAEAADGTNGKTHKEIVNQITQAYYPIYYYYARNYGYNNRDTGDGVDPYGNVGHPLSVVTTLRDAYRNVVKNTTGGVVTVTMVHVDNEVKNHVLTARAEVGDTSNQGIPGIAEAGDNGKAIFTGTDANPVFAAKETAYYLTGDFVGIGEYAADYSRYWKIQDSKRADNNATTLSGLSRLTINKKPVSDRSVVINSVTPGSAAYIGEEGANTGNTSRVDTVRIRDNNNSMNLTDGDDLQIYYRRLTTQNNGDTNLAGTIGETTYYYADAYYYTANGDWYGVDLFERDESQTIEAQRQAWAAANVRKIDGQSVGVYSVEFAAMRPVGTAVINYTGTSGWKDKIFKITPYTGHLNTVMENHIVVSTVERSQTDVIEAIKTQAISTLNITDIYGNKVDNHSVTYEFRPADSNARLDDAGWPCAEGLYAIVVRPYDGTAGDATVAMSQQLVGQIYNDANYREVATGYQALLITKQDLAMNIMAKNQGDTDWQVGRTLNIPYKDSIYVEDDIKAYDTSSDAADDHLKIVMKPTQGSDRPGRRLKITEYTLQTGLPDEPIRDAGGHVLVATDSSGQYVAIGRVMVYQNALGQAKIDPVEATYTGRQIDPKITVHDTEGRLLAEGRDYSIGMTRKHADEDPSTQGATTGVILNAGIYNITVTGTGNYSGKIEDVLTFEVKPKNIDESAEDGNKIPVNIDVSNYYLGQTGNARPRSVLTYNGLVLTPGVDYAETFLGADGEPLKDNSEDFPSWILYEGTGNYAGARKVQETTVGLPPDAELTIINTNNEYAYQASGLFGYVEYSDLAITANNALKESESGIRTSSFEGFEDYDVKIAEVSAWTTATDKDAVFQVMDVGTILDVGAYMVKMTEKNGDHRTGYFFIRIVQRPVTIEVQDEEKVYGAEHPEFKYETDLMTTVGRDTSQRGEVNPYTWFFAHDDAAVSEQGAKAFTRDEGEDVGTYHYSLGSFTAGTNYRLTVSQETMFTINPKNLARDSSLLPAEDIVTNWNDEMDYTGYPVFPLQSITYRSKTLGDLSLALDADYTLTYYKENPGTGYTELSSAPVDVGQYQLRITGTGNYTGTIALNFEVRSAGKSLTLEVKNGNERTYKAAAYYPSVIVRTDSGAALNSANYTLTYTYTDTAGNKKEENKLFGSSVTPFTNAGTYTIFSNGKGNYQNAHGSVEFKINPKPLAEGNTTDGTAAVQVGKIQDFTYDGDPVLFHTGLGADKATYSGLETGGLTDPVNLEYRKDYNLTYMDNRNAGTATVVLVGAGNYTGSRAVEFKILPRTIYVEVGNAEKTYRETDPAYSYTVYADADKTTLRKDIAITGIPARVEGENVGEYPLTVEGSTLSAGPNYHIQLPDNPKLTINPKAIGDGSNVADLISINRLTYISNDEAFEAAKGRITAMYWAQLGQEEIGVRAEIENEDGTACTDPKPSDGKKYKFIVTPSDTANYSGSITMLATAIDADYILTLESAQREFTYTNSSDKPNRYTFTPKSKKVSSLDDPEIWATAVTRNGETLNLENPTDNRDGSYTFELSDAGTYVIEVSCQASEDKFYQGSDVVTVRPKKIGEDDREGGTDPVAVTADLENSTQDYTGEGVELSGALLNYNGVGLMASEEDGEVLNYTVSYANNVAANADAAATVTGLGNYTGIRTIPFKIGPMQFTLQYDANGGDGAGLPETEHSKINFQVRSGEKMSHADEAMDGTVYGVCFVGWSKVNDGGKIYRKGENLPPDMFYGGQTLTPGQGKTITTLYAIWGYDTDGNGRADISQNTIKVVYRQDGSTGGKAPEDSATYLIGDQTKALKGSGLIYTKDEIDYLFMGWTTTAPDAGNAHALTKLAQFNQLSVIAEGKTFYVGNSSDGNFYLYPVWGVDQNRNGTADFMDGQVALIYDLNGGSGEIQTQQGEKGAEVQVTDMIPTRNGALFLGWTTGKINLLVQEPENTLVILDQSKKVTLPSDGSSYTTLYALWAEDVNGNNTPDYRETKYTVKYNVNGGTGTVVDDRPYLEGLAVPLDDGIGLSRESYRFEGWSLRSDGTTPLRGYTVSPADADPTDSTITFYAVWEEVLTAKVTYVQGSAEGAELSPQLVEIGRETAIADLRTRSGYVFLGWVEATEEQTVETVTQTPLNERVHRAKEMIKLTEDITLAPLWIKSELRQDYSLVLYNMSGGDDSEFTASTAYLTKNGNDHFIIDDVPTRDGYVFTGWKSSIASDNTIYDSATNKTCAISGDVTFIAQWEPVPTFSVIYDALGASSGTVPEDKNVYLEDAVVTALDNTGALTKDGYAFSGWRVNGTDQIVKPGGTFTLTGETTLTAVWTVKKYTVTTNAGAGGTITAITPGTEVEHGEDFTFTVTEDSGYRLDKVQVNGTPVTLDENDSYTIHDITENKTVIATFTRRTGGGLVFIPSSGGSMPGPAPEDSGVSNLLITKEHIPFLKGYPDGTFGPDNSITRAEVAQMFYNLLRDKDVPTKARFEDVPEDLWCAKAVNALASLGVIKGVGGGDFAPDRAITRAEFCAIATRFVKETTAADAGFTDVPETHWALRNINTAADYGWVEGYGANRFGPDDLITRAQAAVITNRMLGRLCDKDAVDRGEGRTFPDVMYSHWAWYHIAEATTEHSFTISKDRTVETWIK